MIAQPVFCGNRTYIPIYKVPSPRARGEDFLGGLAVQRWSGALQKMPRLGEEQVLLHREGRP